MERQNIPSPIHFLLFFPWPWGNFLTFVLRSTEFSSCGASFSTVFPSSNSSYFVLPILNSLQFREIPGSVWVSPACAYSLAALRAESYHIIGLTLFVFLFSGIPMLCCLLSDNWKSSFHIFCFGFLVFLRQEDKPRSFNSLWEGAEILIPILKLTETKVGIKLLLFIYFYSCSDIHSDLYFSTRDTEIVG